MLKPLLHLSAGILMIWTMPLACADCFEDAARYQSVNPQILRAIAWLESRNRADAVHKNNNGSTDYGLMQINSVHLAALSRYGIVPEMLMHPCVSIYIAAWHLRQKMNRHGNTWQAVGAYHSEKPERRHWYARQIIQILRKQSMSKE
ncbi:Lytic transglycosylase, Invasion protein (pilT homolog) [Candidatus Glomeribacter gigasporarum BEG34]|uniref:Lytic transglycosylase, Invasion protein (PilT homolog) n=1 Tax=Candidatus Glomeribacter gigasporarum BEG34 TaxID=1070319 RepID=G2JAB7_9BURK|nr:lytic transglycosylase domain-containing protein [Candidatus Glomeribacter gigasporarum]CCD29718.1 Lytic transglycosylase, Invasion protein (pilT homolog) [Candidatus Glomeribacter gigasporarum BEG34]